MIKEIKIPKLSQTMEEAAIVEIIVGIGNEVKKGDNIYEIETDKACVEVQSEQDGFVKHILVKAGQTLPVGTTVMILAQKDEQVPEKLVEQLQKKIPRQKQPVCPAVLAEENSISFTSEDDTIQTGRNIKLGDKVPLSNLQKITGLKMLKSKSEIPCFYLSVRIDVTELAELRKKLNEKADQKLSYNDFFIKAIAAGLENFPIMAGRLVNDAIQLPVAINVALATAVSDCLYVPVIRQPGKRSVKEIARERIRLFEKAQKHKLLPEDIEGASITVSNLGSFGIDSFIPIVVPGQCSIVGIGRIIDEPVPDEDKIIIRKLMNVTISVDHRIANGSYASEFLDYVRKYLNDTSNFS
jgi:pyruvate dehydrogenase E2 component (dihydrolipoamide acetyltransferase)